MVAGWKWELYDPNSGERDLFPINPNVMTSPHRPTNAQLFTAYAIPIMADNEQAVALVLNAKREPHEFEFSGVIRSEEHYDMLIAWSKKRTKIELTDHLERTWQIRLLNLDLEERRPTARTAWRFRYTMTALMYGEVS